MPRAISMGFHRANCSHVLNISTVPCRVYKSCTAIGEMRKDYPCSVVCGGKSSCSSARSVSLIKIAYEGVLLALSLTSPIQLWN